MAAGGAGDGERGAKSVRRCSHHPFRTQPGAWRPAQDDGEFLKSFETLDT
jgi:hypothetical protein